MIRYLLASIYIYWLKRSIRVCHYRRDELRMICEREHGMLDYEEHRLNVRLREAKSARLTARLGEVKA